MKITLGIVFSALLLLTACSPAGQTPIVQAPTTPYLQPTATTTPVPTPASPGNKIVWNNLQVMMDGLEITQDYVTEYGSTRVPPAGQKFLWVHVLLKNVGQAETTIPGSEHFSILYAGIELKPTYGHRQDHTDYTTLGHVIFPAQELDAWLRFDIPTAAELKDLRFVFLPTSAEVGASPSSPNYPYAENKPTFVWKCEG